MGSLASPILVVVFAGAAAAIWVAGIRLSTATDALDARLGLGEALGGLLLLAIATSLPELAITATAAIRGNLELAVGNLIGGIAIQTVVLAVLDAAVDDERPLSFLVGSLVLCLEALMVIGVVLMVVLAIQLPRSANVAGVSPGSLAILATWVGCLVAIRRARAGMPWQAQAPEAEPGRPSRRRPHPVAGHPFQGRSTAAVAAIFGAAAAVTLVAGVAIEEAGNELAARIGLSSGVFGGTVLAAATALPEVSTGIQAVRLGDYALAMSDIFGGNAFMPALFVLADLLAGTPALPSARPTDVWLAGLGGVLTVVYGLGILLRPRSRRLRLGLDSRIVVCLYALGVVGLIVVNSATT